MLVILSCEARSALAGGGSNGGTLSRVAGSTPAMADSPATGCRPTVWLCHWSASGYQAVRLAREDLVHGCSASLHALSDLVAIHMLGRAGSTVPHQVCDRLRLHRGRAGQVEERG